MKIENSEINLHIYSQLTFKAGVETFNKRIIIFSIGGVGTAEKPHVTDSSLSKTELSSVALCQAHTKLTQSRSKT